MRENRSALWEERYAEPVFVLTADQDWTPEWAMEEFLGLVLGESLPVHVFVTNDSPALFAAARQHDEITLGIHPNFMPGTSQGSSIDEIIAYCRALVPAATTFRSHCFHEDTRILRRLFAAGFRADSNLCLFCQPGLVPLVHGCGVLRFPVFLEDDVFFEWAAPDLALGPLSAALFAPGLKVFNFHPTFTSCNVPSAAYYESIRRPLFEGHDDPGMIYHGRGTGTVFGELVRSVREAGYSFTAFPDLVSDAWRHLRQAPDYLFRWGRVAEDWDGR